MKKLTLSILVSAVLFSSAIAVAQDKEQLVQESRQTVKAFGKTLKGELKAAIKKGGPANGIEVCNTKAIKITEAVSKEHGVQLSRTSLKTRNDKNAPTEWQKKVLENFEARKAEGESPKKMEYSEIVEVDGKKQFRYMKAIGTGQVCLNCHGEKVLPAVEAKLSALYPNDKARGYHKGDIRGAFVLTRDVQ